MVIRLWAWLRLLRPTNSIPAAALVLLGAHLACGWPLPRATWTAAGAMWAITSFGYVTNDIHDLAADRINKPDRPLPSGRVSLRAAHGAAMLLSIGAIGLASTIDSLAVIAACLALAMLMAYNIWLKSTVLLGNVLIAVLSGMALGVGGYTVGYPWRLAWPAAPITSFILAREVLKTIEDVEGDRQAGVQTISTRWGEHRASHIFTVLAFGCAGITWLAYRFADLSTAYLVITSMIALGMVYSAIRVERSPTPASARVGLRLSKVSYALGLLALLVA
ncbi:MAG: geranylgeranylglycerol-phosphate geranylgeranyltransferase [Anaerolineae bacterium]|nr:geranylgeranylglycerol-phosphate geranylgeranyltransferase [Anaerolineae bacterium]